MILTIILLALLSLLLFGTLVLLVGHVNDQKELIKQQHILVEYWRNEYEDKSDKSANS